MKKATAIGIIVIMALSLGACGGKSSSDSGPAPRGAAAAPSESDGETEGASGNPVAAELQEGAGAAGANETGAAGANTTAVTPSLPVLLDPPSMKTAYRPETEDEKYARELTGVYLLTDLEDAISADSGAIAAERGAEGSPMYMEFFDNGTLRETVFGDPMGGLWDREYLTIGADRVPYTFSGNHLTVHTDNMELTFTRTTQEELTLLLETGRDAGADSDEEDNSVGSTGDDEAYDEYGDGPESEEILIEDDLCRMTATGYDFSDPRGFVIHVHCENYSVYTLAFNITDAVINNIMFEPGTEEEEHWTLEVAPMSSGESDIVFRAEKALEYGITSYDYVLLNLWVRNVDNWMDAPVYTGDKELYPTGKANSGGQQVLKRKTSAGEKKIAEESAFNFTILGSEQRANGDFVLKVCIENNSWQDLAFNWDDVYVNGVLLDPFWAAEAMSKTIRYDDIVFPAGDLQEKGITTVSDVTFTMTVYDSRNWLSYSIYTETSGYRA